MTWQTTEVCASACAGKLCAPIVCKPGTRQCSAQGEVEECNGSGSAFVPLYACSMGCESGACLAPICAPFATRCADDEVEQCAANGGAWAVVEDCAHGCSDGRCADVDSGSCTSPGARRCYGDIVQQCSSLAAWETLESCAATCREGGCTVCIPGEQRCNGATIEQCNPQGGAFATVNFCATACVDGTCTACVPGRTTCDGTSVDMCLADGSEAAFLKSCMTSCAEGDCTEPVCAPLQTRCNGDVVELCNVRGTGYVSIETCGNGCANGQCADTVVSIVCAPGSMRCNGLDAEVCNGLGTAWVYYHSCLTQCDAGSCIGSACRPVVLLASPAEIAADGISSTLVYSQIIASAEGVAVADNQLFTVAVTAGSLLAADADATLAGVQVRSAGGRLDFAVASGTAPGEAIASVAHVDAASCVGTTRVRFSADGPKSFAEDFTTATRIDVSTTTARLVSKLGLVDPVASAIANTGDGRDGPLLIESAAASYNINVDAVPTRVYPDAVSYAVAAVGANYVDVNNVVAGVEAGDELIIFQTQGASGSVSSTVGTFEYAIVREINAVVGRIIFVANLANTYNVAGRVIVQRVPHYTDVVARGTLTADAWDGERGGLLVFRALGGVTVYGAVSMKGKGYRGDLCLHEWSPGESWRASTCGYSTNANGGGGGGSYAGLTQCGYAIVGAGGAHGLAGETGYAADSGSGGVGGTPGAAYGVQTLDRITYGSAGGSAYGFCGGWTTDRGGAGGGAIVIAAETISILGSIDADGDNGRRAATHLWAGGGGGAGGTIQLSSSVLGLGANHVTARGGADGMARSLVGDGAPGRVRIDYASMLGTTTTSPEYYTTSSGTLAWGDQVQSVLLGPGTTLIPSATLQTVLADHDADDVEVYFTTSGASGTFGRAYRDTEFVFGSPQGSDLRYRALLPATEGRNRLLGISFMFAQQ